jgi:hypothetical protein
MSIRVRKSVTTRQSSDTSPSIREEVLVRQSQTDKAINVDQWIQESENIQIERIKEISYVQTNSTQFVCAKPCMHA